MSVRALLCAGAFALTAIGGLTGCANTEYVVCFAADFVCDDAPPAPECDFAYVYDEQENPVCPDTDTEARVARGDAFRATFEQALVRRGRVRQVRRKLVAKGAVAAGSFTFAGRQSGLRRFRAGRFAARANVTFATRRAPDGSVVAGSSGSDSGYLLLTARGGRACLRFRTRYRLSGGRLSARGRFTLAGGTGDAAKLTGGGTFARTEPADGPAAIAGRAKVARASRRPLPRACRALLRVRAPAR